MTTSRPRPPANTWRLRMVCRSTARPPARRGAGVVRRGRKSSGSSKKDTKSRSKRGARDASMTLASVAQAHPTDGLQQEGEEPAPAKGDEWKTVRCRLQFSGTREQTADRGPI